MASYSQFGYQQGKNGRVGGAGGRMSFGVSGYRPTHVSPSTYRPESDRLPTPDSEAMASSEDEHDHVKSLVSASKPPQAVNPPKRRDSWLSDIQSSQRKPSLGGMSLASQCSQPPTPGETPGWTANARPLSKSGSLTWDTNIWSPQDTTARRESADLPFQIPLSPTRKTIRSQSYSVGQMERGSPGVMHKPSRKSMLGSEVTGDSGGDPAGLGKVIEDEDHESEGSDAGVRLPMHSDGGSSLLKQAAVENANRRVPPGRASITAATVQENPYAYDPNFGGFQSRRHSFANVPSDAVVHAPMARQIAALEEAAEDVPAIAGNYPNQQQHMAALQARQQQNLMNAASMSGSMGLSRGERRSPVLLYLVQFKCCRADVYYADPSNGLQIKKGDLMIVEGDRGSDLGQVQEVELTWEQAKRLRQENHIAHTQNLMLFSRNAQTLPEEAFLPPMKIVDSILKGELMGPSALHGDNGFDAELKPKLIKRHAAAHEIAQLKDKEGAEAKAKRVCQTKAQDHNLVMEILDAEYQHDYKKLTFYYYSTSYVNFNDLVTDLFKLYKTRIWMSSVNPAVFTPITALSSTVPMAAPPSSVPARGAHRATVSGYAPGQPSFGRGDFSSRAAQAGYFPAFENQHQQPAAFPNPSRMPQHPMMNTAGPGVPATAAGMREFLESPWGNENMQPGQGARRMWHGYEAPQDYLDATNLPPWAQRNFAVSPAAANGAGGPQVLAPQPQSHVAGTTESFLQNFRNLAV
ncbi:PSP1 C-terminal conserved region-domain-containing protein [Lineolata rhizophorae]|uniref:PSP1 C-terminal conserved region-domain-containing protein n=1 Tax=Lineolata rhizophorae TaxID=578093 RepID=A0A6A6P3J7_9PEZI|nr:PSP1 C-terminal conserved region-domain-containing protein [Lineolata rhizophorae]